VPKRSRAKRKARERAAVRVSRVDRCYASPLNRFCASFCSAFHDTDRFFGAAGSFGAGGFSPTCGSFEANPPFDHASVCRCFTHIGRLLAAATGPMSFVVVIPVMEMPREPRAHL